MVLLLVRGLATGVTRYLGAPEPDWAAGFSFWFPALGLVMGVSLVRLMLPWLPLFLRPTSHRTWREDHPRADVRVTPRD